MKKYKTRNMNLQLFADNPTPCYFTWDNLVDGVYHVKPFTIYASRYLKSNGSTQILSVNVNYVKVTSYAESNREKQILFSANSDMYAGYGTYTFRLLSLAGGKPPVLNPYLIKLSYLTHSSVGNNETWSGGQILNRTFPLHLTSYDEQNPIGVANVDGYWYIESKSIDILDYNTNQSICGMKFFSVLPKKTLKINNKIIEKFNNKNIKTFNNIEIMSGISN